MAAFALCFIWLAVTAYLVHPLFKSKSMLLSESELPEKQGETWNYSQKFNRDGSVSATGVLREPNAKNLPTSYMVFAEKIFRGAKQTFPVNSKENLELIKKNYSLGFKEDFSSVNTISIDKVGDSFIAVELIVRARLPEEENAGPVKKCYVAEFTKKDYFVVMDAYGTNFGANDFFPLVRKAEEKIDARLGSP